MKREIQVLEQWMFALGAARDCLKEGRLVTVPHTWNVEKGTEDTWGTGWYEHTFTAPKAWQGKCVRVYFGAVYHNAVVYLNGKEIIRHGISGYTPFEAELTNDLVYGGENRLTVQVNNEFTDQILPYNRSFDWANDGGLIRQVKLIITGRHYIQFPRITARPILTENRKKTEAGYGLFGVESVSIGGSGSELKSDELTLEWELYRGCDEEKTEKKAAGEMPCRDGGFHMEAVLLKDIIYWHFDEPQLYTVSLTLKNKGQAEDTAETVIGFREFRTEGVEFYLNGEPVRVAGTEWMPGSDPAWGMAETKEQLEKMLRCLKESNCVFTRFHWQQDDMVYDWCDRHGMLVQEEVPFWGANPEKAGKQQWEIFQYQMKEMIKAHYNHPSIISWCVGNELDAQAEETRQYIRDAVAYTHQLDYSRPANYVSNSFYKNPVLDGTASGDIMMINDYIGTWLGELNQYGELEKMLRANPGKPMAPSEFGLCEPAFQGGDERRTEIFLAKMEAYRHFPEIAGTINFCLNDYRTQMGEDGEGKYRKRIHGSTDLQGNPKPSYYIVQRECAPFTVTRQEQKLMIACRKDMPCYEMKGYFGEILDSEEKVIRTVRIPTLQPGDTWEAECGIEEKIRIYRKNGDLTGIYPM